MSALPISLATLSVIIILIAAVSLIIYIVYSLASIFNDGTTVIICTNGTQLVNNTCVTPKPVPPPVVNDTIPPIVNDTIPPIPIENQLPVITVNTPINCTINTDCIMVARVDDADGNISQFIWNQESGSQVTLTKTIDHRTTPDTYTATFKPTVGDIYVFSVEAQDDKGATTLKSITANVPTPTPEPEPEPIPIGTEKNVIMVGDIYGSIGQEVAQSIKAKNPELVVLLGDLGYDSDGDYLNAVYGDLRGKLACVIGNHDDTQVFEDYCGNAYFIKLNNVLFLGLNTEDNEAEQATEAVSLLKDTEFMENITSVHVMTHKPCAAPSSTNHGVESDDKAMCDKINAATNLPMFYDNGHNHNLAEDILSDGTVVHNSGGGGRSGYDCDTSVDFCKEVKGFLEYVIKPNGQTTYSFYDENGVKIR